MAKLPRRPRPQKRKSDLPAGAAVASPAIVPKKRDPRQPGIFDAALPAFVQPQLAKLVTEAPDGERWAHELKLDGYRMHARIDRGRVQLITARSGLDWTSKYPATAEALKQLPVSRAYLDGELCAVREDGTTSFSLMQSIQVASWDTAQWWTDLVLPRSEVMPSPRLRAVGKERADNRECPLNRPQRAAQT